VSWWGWSRQEKIRRNTLDAAGGKAKARKPSSAEVDANVAKLEALQDKLRTKSTSNKK